MTESMQHTTDVALTGAEHGHAAPAMHTSLGLDSRKLGIWFFIASEVLFFTALVATYLVLRGKTPIAEGVGHLDLNIAAAMTFILLMSSFTMVTALARIREGNSRGMVIWLAATAIMGGLFLSSQAFEWNLLFSEGILPSNSIFGATFFILTGFHGTHVLLGIVWIIGTILRGTKGTGFDASNNLGVELTGLYWHFVDLVWVVIFMVVYLIN